MRYINWDKDLFYEFVFTYLDARNSDRKKIYDTPFGDIEYELRDSTLVLFFDDEEEARELNDFVDAEDVYDISFHKNIAFVKLIDL